jgi:hypothetical protein
MASNILLYFKHEVSDRAINFNLLKRDECS